MNPMKRNIALLALAQAIMMTCMSLMVASAALIGARLTHAPALATLPLAVLFLATMTTTLPASLLMQRIGRRAAFLLGNTLGVAGALLAALAIVEASFWLFCSAAALMGTFNGFGIYYRFAAADVADESFRSRAISYVLAGGVVAAFAGPNLANLTRELIPSALFAGSFLILAGVIACAIAALLFVHIPKGSGPVHPTSGRPLPEIIRQPVFVVAALGAMLGYGIMSLVMTATPLAMEVCGIGFDDTAFVIQWHVFAMFAPAFFTGALIKRFGEVNVMLAGALLNAGCIAINLNGVTVDHYWTALAMLGVGWNFLFIGGTSLLTRAYRPEEMAKTQGLNDFLVFTTVAAASLSAGALQFNYGWRAVNQGVIPLIALIVLALLWLKLKQGGSAEPIAAEK